MEPNSTLLGFEEDQPCRYPQSEASSDGNDSATCINYGRPPSILNVSNMYPIQYAQPMLGYIMPFLLVITIIANTLIVVVLSKRHMRTPTNLVLMSMALSDMFTLLFPAPWLFYMYTLDNHAQPLMPIGACYAFVYMHEVIPALFHTASIWLTLALAVQRYIYVCHPPLARTWCTVPRVMKGILWIYFFATLHQSTRFFDRVWVPLSLGGGHVTVCVEKDAAWVETIDINVYYNIYYWFRVLFVHVIPCAALIVLNALLFQAMREAQRKRAKLFSCNETSRKSECKNPAGALPPQ